MSKEKRLIQKEDIIPIDVYTKQRKEFPQRVIHHIQLSPILSKKNIPHQIIIIIPRKKTKIINGKNHQKYRK